MDPNPLNTQSPAAGWYDDPSGRFQHRYWSGEEWTENVSTDGVTTFHFLDAPFPPPTGTPPPPPPTAGHAAPAASHVTPAAHCRTCGASVSQYETVCRQCGAPPQAGTSFCWHCATATAPAAVVCVNCGVALAPIAGVPAFPGQKSKLTAGLLGIFLGGFGVHRFYLGFTGIGVAQIAVTIVTCGIGGIWGLIEGILILTGSMNQDSLGRPLGP